MDKEELKKEAKRFLDIYGHPNTESNYEDELLDTMAGFAQQQVENTVDVADVSEPVINEQAYYNCHQCGKRKMIGTMCINPITGECDNVC